MYAKVAALLAVAGLLYALLNLNIRYAVMALGGVVALVVVTHPRLALYQFVFVFFFHHALREGIPVYAIDLSAGLVIIAGLLDVLLNNRFTLRIPRLTFNYVYIIAALVVCGIFGYWPELLGLRVVTFSFLVATFLAVYRLSTKVSVSEMVNWFFILTVLHSVYVLVPFVASGGAYRSFGFADVFFDDLAMIALPIGLALYLGAERHRAWLYLLGSIVVLGGLVATQSRASFLFALAAVAFVIVVSRRRAVRLSENSELRLLMPARIKLIVSMVLVLIATTVILRAGMLMAVIERYEQLFSFDLGGSVGFRLELWRRAWMAFVDHPVFGVGPGGYHRLIDIYSTLHLTPNYYYLRTLGAHNAFLHYLSITGLVGGAGLVALFVNQFRLARHGWQRAGDALMGQSLALYGWAFLFAVTLLIEAGWMWGHLSFTAVFFAALISRQHTICAADQALDTQ
ncbi:MAG: hypothetical protein DRP45_04945 [Candidatus Zixiibacteriota bacterium]|nr:MAG: hypothetical protein DRP45_04945 [candidate division Zixibacteria bacterium]